MGKTKAIELVETRQGCAMFERTPRYNVMLHGVKVDQLYFNMRGYVGYLPMPDGSKLNIGEKGISAFRKEAAILNREWEESTRKPQEEKPIDKTRLFHELAELMHATEGDTLRIGNVEFWIDADGPWKGQLTSSIPASQWDTQAIGNSVADLAKCHPEVSRLVARYA